MPSTITTYYTFQPATKARSSQVNTNFSNYRGDLIPINEATASSSNNTHYLGAPDHYWAGAYCQQVSFGYMTTTAIPVLVGDTTNTTGAYDFKIGGTTVAYVGASGLTNASLENSARTVIAVTFTSGNSTWTVPAGHTNIRVIAFGGGGGGGGGAHQTGGSATGGGAGGNGAWPVNYILPVTALEVLSITVGSGGSGGASGSTGGAAASGSSGTDTIIYRAGTPILFAYGAKGGGPGTSAAAGQPNLTTSGIYLYTFPGGAGGATNSGTAGSPSFWQTSGAFGTGPGNAGGGGGGGSSYGLGGAGGIGTITGGPGTAGAGGIAAGGGGGAAKNTSTGGALGGPGGPGGAGLLTIYTTKIT